MFKETPEGSTQFCLSCEKRKKIGHTCGIINQEKNTISDMTEQRDRMEWERKLEDELYFLSQDGYGHGWRQMKINSIVGIIKEALNKQKINLEKSPTMTEIMIREREADFYDTMRANYVRKSQILHEISAMEVNDINPETKMPYYLEFNKGHKEGYNTALSEIKEKINKIGQVY